MINNRYVELGFCKTPIITFQYPNIDWCGAKEYLNIIETYEDFNNIVNKCINRDDEIIKKTIVMKQFVLNQHKLYFEKLISLYSYGNRVNLIKCKQYKFILLFIIYFTNKF